MAGTDHLTPAQARAAALADFGFGPPLAHDHPPNVPITWIVTHLRDAAIGHDPLPSTVQGLRTFLAALPRGDLSQASPDLLTSAFDAVEPVFRRLVGLEPRGVPLDDIALGLGALRSLVGLLRELPTGEAYRQADALVPEQINLVGLLASELDASERRQRIKDSGHQVARIGAIRMAMAQADSAGLPLH